MTSGDPNTFAFQTLAPMSVALHPTHVSVVIPEVNNFLPQVPGKILNDCISLEPPDNREVGFKLGTTERLFSTQYILDIDRGSTVDVSILSGLASVLCSGPVPTFVNPDMGKGLDVAGKA
jgi:hypothetical protein